MANRKSIIDFHQIQNVPMICFISFNAIYNVKMEKYSIKACKRNTFTLLILVPWYSKNLMGIQNNLSMLREGLKKTGIFQLWSDPPHPKNWKIGDKNPSKIRLCFKSWKIDPPTKLENSIFFNPSLLKLTS